MNSYGGIPPRASLSSAQRHRQRQQWQKSFTRGRIVGNEKTHGLQSKQHSNGGLDLKRVDDRRNLYQRYGGKYRKSAVRMNSSTGRWKSALQRQNSGDGNVSMFNRFENDCEMRDNIVRSKHGDSCARRIFDEKLERGYSDKRKRRYFSWIEHEELDYQAGEEIRTKWWFLEKFRSLYRRLKTTKVPKQSVRTDMLAWHEMDKRYGERLCPAKTLGKVPGVEVGDEFDLRLELKIMGIHFLSVNGIDTMVKHPCKTLIATSVVATEGYDDNMLDSNVLMYGGEGGKFEDGPYSKGKAVKKDQAMKRGNLGLRNSIKVRNEVRVVRGIKRGRSSRPKFVYDGLYRVDSYSQIYGSYGNKQYVFKLVRCPGQKSIVWAKYK